MRIGRFGRRWSQPEAPSTLVVLQEQLTRIGAEVQALRNDVSALRTQLEARAEDDNQAAAVIIFLHLPKAAGTTLAKLIASNFKPKQIFHTPEESIAFSAFAEIDLPMRRKFRFIYGHMQFGIHRLVPLPSTYITLVRHPVSRICSAYRYYKQYSHSRLHREITRGGMSLRDYVVSGLDNSIDNLQTRFLSGDSSIYASDRLVDEGLYNVALANLQRDDVLAAPHDQFDAFALLVCEHFRLGYRQYGRENSTTEDPDLTLDDETLELIMVKNRYDYLLYLAAQRKFTELIDKADPYLRLLIAKRD